MRCLSLCALAIAFGCNASKKEKESEPEPVPVPVPNVKGTKTAPEPPKTVAIGEAVVIGDLTLKVTSAAIGPFQTTDYAMHNPALLIRFEIQNKNPNRIIAVPSQFGAAKVSDNVGNTYKELRLFNQFGGRCKIADQITPEHEVRLRSDESPVTDVVVFETPVPGASRVVIDLDATKYGGKGVIRLDLPKSALEPQPPKKK